MESKQWPHPTFPKASLELFSQVTPTFFHLLLDGAHCKALKSNLQIHLGDAKICLLWEVTGLLPLVIVKACIFPIADDVFMRLVMLRIC